MSNIFSTYKYIWICGLAASGKTSALQYLSKVLTQCTFFNDSEEIVEYILQDKDQRHHKNVTHASFVITDSEPFIYALRSLCKKILKKKNCIIELSRGKDEKGIVDLSYKSFSDIIPKEIQKDSLCVYIQTDAQTRIRRNEERAPLQAQGTSPLMSFQCPKTAMHRFFLQDDFFETVKDVVFDYIVIRNTSTLETLHKKLKRIFVV